MVHWPTANARDWKDSGPTQGNRQNPNLGTAVVKDAANWPTPRTNDDAAGRPNDGTARLGPNGQRYGINLSDKVLHGHPAPENPSTGGSRQGLWPTPDATNANDGVPWEKFEQGMQERRARVKAAVAQGLTKQGSGRSANLCAAVQNPQWATPSTGKLNPRWVEALMGLPIGWVMASCASPVTIAPTSFGCWATESSQQPQPELL